MVKKNRTAIQQKIQKVLSVGQVAARSGVPVSTVHYYEEQGLISSWRSTGNHRCYARDVIRRIAIIKVAQRLGIPLKEISHALAALPQTRTPSAKDWQRLSVSWKSDLDDRIKRLTRLRDQLATCIGCGCLSIEDCPLRNPGDNLSSKGAGPHLLEQD